MPDPDLTQNFRVGENRTRNRPGILVGSVGSGHVGFSGSPVSFGFISSAFFWLDPSRYGRYLARSQPIFGWIRWDLAKSRQDLVGSQRDLTGSRRIWTRSRRDHAGSHSIWWVSGKFSLNNFKYRQILYVFVGELQISLEVFGYMLGSGCSGFGRGKPLTDPKASGSVGGDPPLTAEVLVWAVFGLASGRLFRLVGYTGCVDSQLVQCYSYCITGASVVAIVVL